MSFSFSSRAKRKKSELEMVVFYLVGDPETGFDRTIYRNERGLLYFTETRGGSGESLPSRISKKEAIKDWVVNASPEKAWAELLCGLVDFAAFK